MKKQKVYSASDFVGMTSSILVEDCWWTADSVVATTPGEHSKLPLFELRLRQIETKKRDDLPAGFVDASSKLTKTRSYFVREGRPQYTELVELWRDSAGDSGAFYEDAMDALKGQAFYGHVERVSGVSYTKNTRNGTVVSKNHMDVWYPEEYEPGSAVSDFLYMCNKGIYTPVIDDAEKEDDVKDVIAKLDPAIIKAIMSMKK